MVKELTCIVCPRGCNIKVKMENNEIKDIDGHSCVRGLEYAKNEMTHPVRTITTTIKTVTGEVVSVKTDKPVPKEMIFECMQEINKVEVSLPVIIGDIVVENILGTGANVVATQNLY